MSPRLPAAVMAQSSPVPSSRRRELAAAAVSALVLAAFSTLGDWIWAAYIADGAVIPGVVHGVLFFLLLALVLGLPVRSAGALGRLLVALPVAGLVLAAVFYPLAHAIGYLGALLVTWVGMWLALAFALRWARERDESGGRALARGLIAATASGLAFWLVSDMWTAPAAATGYPLRFGYWTFAFLPGLLALLVARPPAGRRAG